MLYLHDLVFLSLAAPVVDGCMGDDFNGLILFIAYDQAASSKCYMMDTLPGILNLVTSDKGLSAPVSPRVINSVRGAVSDAGFDGIDEPQTDCSTSVEPAIIPRAFSCILELVGSSF